MKKEQVITILEGNTDEDPFNAVFRYLQEQAVDPIEIVEEINVAPWEEEEEAEKWISDTERKAYVQYRETHFGEAFGRLDEEAAARHADAEEYFYEQGVDETLLYEPGALRYRIVFKRAQRPFFKDKPGVYAVMACWAEYLGQHYIPADLQWSSVIDHDTTTICIQFRCDYGS